MFGADIYLKPLHTSIADIYKVFYLLLCCLKGMWVHPYIVTPAKLAPDFGIQVQLWSENDAITSWFRLIFPSDHSILKDESQKRETSEMNLKKQENCELRFIYLSEQS